MGMIDVKDSNIAQGYGTGDDIKITWEPREDKMGKMSALNIEQTNKFVGALDTITQFIDTELMQLTKYIPMFRDGLLELQDIINDYRDEIKGEK